MSFQLRKKHFKANNSLKMWFLFGLLSVLIAINRAQEFSAPYQVSIRSNATAIVGNATAGGQLTHICSGVIIKAEYILTTAGCINVHDKLKNSSLGRVSLGNHESVQRNVISVIPHVKYNSTTLENDIALLKQQVKQKFILLNLINSHSHVCFDEFSPGSGRKSQITGDIGIVHNSTAVQWIELQQPQRTSFAHSNNVNENCFTNAYNNSVGALNYPFTLVRNVSHVDDKFCSDFRASSVSPQHALKSNESCWEYRLNSNSVCQPTALQRSEDRGTGIVCNFKLAAILAEINPPAYHQNCNQIKYTTAFYTPVGLYRDWVENECGFLYYSVGLPGTTVH
ncbi:uncharacterized protein LOC129728480 [Wyeomyia smithii]|uniref:uncharacterized protein LOC129728480 n=1 Tax=Wyeomyia smithii TaxID=174621 RepID=UPI002468070D|nr:uncharacterized protein LOC129728480 [Wyeomyia smithii]